ncbi:E3 ubiquitin-protein ligase ATL15-like [Selaginella moellendorffii]|uniref:E3 ubiquitin-protein ligase ATL15-like n=1 Tax=Selaginella moellendorffii TaxID=88036 RepID=UPI000D1D042A|nr:E3 ubiquitin-protein ligase ATL15-like [Selaginella moellendorffii]|eukprot:XP_024515639.1 E3 ubiquitin-protein ligase ATL15-like [Selaginella moellendorffii]
MAVFRHSIVSIFRQPHGAAASFDSSQQQSGNLTAVPHYGSPVRFNPMIGFGLAALFTAFFFMGSLCVYVKRSCSIARRRRAHAATIALPPFSELSAFATPIQPGLDKETIESLPVFPFTSEKCSKYGKVATECSVCLTDFQEDEVVKILPGCSHFFHTDCIDMWLFSHSTCPLCRCILVPVRCCSDHPESPNSISQPPAEVSIAINDEQTRSEELESQSLLDSSEQRDQFSLDSSEQRSKTPKVSARDRFLQSLHRSNSSPPIQSFFPEQEHGDNGRRENAVNESLSRPHSLRRAVSSDIYQSV